MARRLDPRSRSCIPCGTGSTYGYRRCQLHMLAGADGRDAMITSATPTAKPTLILSSRPGLRDERRTRSQPSGWVTRTRLGGRDGDDERLGASSALRELGDPETENHHLAPSAPWSLLCPSLRERQPPSRSEVDRSSTRSWGTRASAHGWGPVLVRFDSRSPAPPDAVVQDLEQVAPMSTAQLAAPTNQPIALLPAVSDGEFDTWILGGAAQVRYVVQSGLITRALYRAVDGWDIRTWGEPEVIRAHVRHGRRESVASPEVSGWRKLFQERMERWVPRRA
jgi:hypothetical protein